MASAPARRCQRWRSMAALPTLAMLAWVAALPASAQQPAAVLPPSTQPAETALTDPSISFASQGSLTDYHDVFVRSGPVFSLGGGVLNDGLKTGWAIESGLQLPLFDVPTGGGPLGFFLELGGEYADNHRSGPLVDPGDTFFCLLCHHDDKVSELYQTQITDVQRVAFQAALAGSYFPAFFDPAANQPRLSLTWDLGMRAGVGIAHFNYTPTAIRALTQQLYIANHFNVAELPTRTSGDQTGFLFGLYGSLGVGITFPNVSVSQYTLGDVTVGAQVQFAHDWINLRGADDTYGLGTLTPLFSVALHY